MTTKAHIPNLWEDKKLSFEEIEDIFSLAAQGKLSKLCEKVDGQFLSTLWDGNQLKVARNNLHLFDSGVSIEEFASQKNVANYSFFFRVHNELDRVIKSIDPQLRQDVFENHWLSFEILDKESPNIYHYGKNCIVFHETSSKQFSKLIKNLPELQKHTSWELKGPIKIRQKGLSEDRLMDYCEKLQDIYEFYKMDGKNTIQKFLKAGLYQKASYLPILPERKEQLISNMVKEIKLPLSAIIKNLNWSGKNAVNNFFKQKNEFLQEIISPLEFLIRDFSCELLREMKSALIENPVYERKRIQQEVINTISFIQKRDKLNEERITALKKNSAKLRSINNILPIEGIIFEYNDKKYKMNGYFGPLNQIMWSKRELGPRQTDII